MAFQRTADGEHHHSHNSRTGLKALIFWKIARA
jgi:hypothetical protein